MVVGLAFAVLADAVVHKGRNVFQPHGLRRGIRHRRPCAHHRDARIGLHKIVRVQPVGRVHLQAQQLSLCVIRQGMRTVMPLLADAAAVVLHGVGVLARHVRRQKLPGRNDLLTVLRTVRPQRLQVRRIRRRGEIHQFYGLILVDPECNAHPRLMEFDLHLCFAPSC